MIVEMRTYELEPGRVPAFLALMESEGIPIERPALGQMLGFYTNEIGTLNQVIHLWGYASFEERQRRRATLAADSRWQAFLPKVLPMIRHMRNELLQPAPFAMPHTLDWVGPMSASVPSGSKNLCYDAARACGLDPKPQAHS